MVTLILIVVYIAFIGLGFPNTIFGAAWPAMYEDLKLPLSAANYVNILVPGSTAVAGLFSARITNKFGTAGVTLVGSILIGLSLLGFSVSGNVLCLCLCSIPLGLTTGVLDAALNNYVALHYKPMFVNFLHCSFGIGASISLYLMSIMLGKSSWNEGYRTVALVQFGIVGIVLLVFPVWSKLQCKDEKEEELVQPKTLSLVGMMKMPMVRLAWIICMATNALEGVCSTWGASYLVLSHDFGADEAAKAITAFTIGMTLGRFWSGVLAAKMNGWHIIYLSAGITFTSLVLMFVPVPTIVIAGFFMMGLGNGPIYPTMMQLAPENFGKDISASVIGTQMASAYIGIMVAPPIFGWIAQEIGSDLFTIYLLVFFVVMVFCIYRFVRIYCYEVRS